MCYASWTSKKPMIMLNRSFYCISFVAVAFRLNGVIGLAFVSPQFIFRFSLMAALRAFLLVRGITARRSFISTPICSHYGGSK